MNTQQSESKKTLESMNTPNADLLTSQNLSGDTENKQHSSDNITTRKPIDGTPYYIVGNEETGYAITWGHYRLGKLHKTSEDAEGDLYGNEFHHIIVNLCIAINHFAQSGVKLEK